MRKNLVVQSNKLVEAHYKQEYSIQEQRMVLWIISEINKEDYFYSNTYNGKSITISAKEYSEIIGISEKNVYRDAAKIGEDLMQKVIKIKNNDGGWLMFNWFYSMEYLKGKAKIEITISPKIIPYIIDLKEKFTAFRLENILYLNSSHAIKLYQILAQYKKLGERILTIDEIRSILGISSLKSYKTYADLKRRILEISKREINQKTNLSISYTEIKESRKVVAIKFKITHKPTQDEQARKLFEEFISGLHETETLYQLFLKNGYGNTYIDEQFQKFVSGNFVNYKPNSTLKLQIKIDSMSH